MPIDLGKPSKTYLQSEIDTMRTHATGNTKEPYVDHYKEGDYSNITTEIEKFTPKGDENGFSEVTARMGPWECDNDDIKAIEALSTAKPDSQLDDTLVPTEIQKIEIEIAKVEAETKTRWQRFKAWVRKVLRIK